MTHQEVQEVRSCLTNKRTLFNYGKDWYAIQLIKLFAGSSCSISELKRSPFASLLQKESVKRWLGSLGKKEITRDDLALLWPNETETYRLTLDIFDGWIQTSRRGKNAYNLVLQLNLHGGEAQFMDRLINKREDDPFEASYHPIHQGRHRTLAWARIDLDWESGQALIEEIQNDRIRYVKEFIEESKDCNDQEMLWYGSKLPIQTIVDYWNVRLRISRKIWDEAMLSATISFLVHELGIRKIYYHTPLSAEAYKSEGAEDAPRSIYTKLPRKFCFKPTNTPPSFLRKHRRSQQQTPFQLLVV